MLRKLIRVLSLESRPDPLKDSQLASFHQTGDGVSFWTGGRKGRCGGEGPVVSGLCETDRQKPQTVFTWEGSKGGGDLSENLVSVRTVFPECGSVTTIINITWNLTKVNVFGLTPTYWLDTSGRAQQLMFQQTYSLSSAMRYIMPKLNSPRRQTSYG